MLALFTIISTINNNSCLKKESFQHENQFTFKVFLFNVMSLSVWKMQVVYSQNLSVIFISVLVQRKGGVDEGKTKGYLTTGEEDNYTSGICCSRSNSKGLSNVMT